MAKVHMAGVRKSRAKRYLVTEGSLPPLSGGETVSTGYLCTDPAVRLRVSEAGAMMQVWSPEDPTMFFEYEIPVQDAESMMKLCFQRTLRTTWTVEHAGRTWRVNQYMGRHDGVVTAVLSLPSTAEGYEEPPWVGRNVTADRRYTDEGLARLQRPPPDDDEG